MNSFDELIAAEPSREPLTIADIQAACEKLSETSRRMQLDAKMLRAILDYNGLTEDGNFADEAERICNKQNIGEHGVCGDVRAESLKRHD